MDKRQSDGLWAKILKAESAAEKVISDQIKEWSVIIVVCLELGTEVATLRGKSQASEDIIVSGLFLRKSLNDMRAAWKLLQMGYTSQAASVIASLFENGLLCQITAGNLENSKKILASMNDPERKLPWTVIDMCRLSALKDGQKRTEDELRLRTISDYSTYKWLCRIKHPTFDSAFHDASSTKIEGEGYVVIPLPDVSQKDLDHKIMIIEIGLTKLFFAIKSFANSIDILELAKTSPIAKNWMDAMLNLFEEWGKIKKEINLSFDLKGSKLYQEFDVLMRKKHGI